jgi:pilus assembly protein Flp/PilA
VVLLKGWFSEKGQGLLEYAVIIVIVAVLVMIVLMVLGSGTGNMFSNTVSSI